ncbi:MAG: hypothetical protein Q8P50_12330 [Bacillota bacterium]|nr:hypothetical protein [Bacillota bacterium]
MRRELPALITAVTGVVYVLAGFLNIPALSTMKGHLDKWFLIVAATTIMVGVVNLLNVHLDSIRHQKQGHGNSVLLLAALAGTVLLGLSETSQGTNYRNLYRYVLSPLSGTMYSLLCFYIASAAYRAFRMRNADAVLLLATAVILMLGVVPVGDVIWAGLPGVSQWLMNVPNTAGMRGILIGATLGAVATGVRIILGIERGHLGRID